LQREYAEAVIKLIIELHERFSLYEGSRIVKRRVSGFPLFEAGTKGLGKGFEKWL